MDKTITIYSTPTCHYCEAAKNFMNVNNVTFTEVDVSTDAEQRQHMVEMTGQMGVPVIRIDDDVIVGFDEEKVKEVLGI